MQENPALPLRRRFLRGPYDKENTKYIDVRVCTFARARAPNALFGG